MPSPHRVRRSRYADACPRAPLTGAEWSALRPLLSRDGTRGRVPA
jgi:hypothetical protein